VACPPGDRPAADRRRRGRSKRPSDGNLAASLAPHDGCSPTRRRRHELAQVAASPCGRWCSPSDRRKRARGLQTSEEAWALDRASAPPEEKVAGCARAWAEPARALTAPQAGSTTGSRGAGCRCRPTSRRCPSEAGVARSRRGSASVSSSKTAGWDESDGSRSAHTRPITSAPKGTSSADGDRPRATTSTRPTSGSLRPGRDRRPARCRGLTAAHPRRFGHARPVPRDAGAGGGRLHRPTDWRRPRPLGVLEEARVRPHP